MLRKLSIALSALLLSGMSVAAQQGFPSSPNESASYGPATGARVSTPFWLRFGGAAAAATSEVDESHPAHTAGQRMPTMEGARGATNAAGRTRVVPEPSSVDEAHPGHTAGQSMPSMGRGR